MSPYCVIFKPKFPLASKWLTYPTLSISYQLSIFSKPQKWQGKLLAAKIEGNPGILLPFNLSACIDMLTFPFFWRTSSVWLPHCHIFSVPSSNQMWLLIILPLKSHECSLGKTFSTCGFNIFLDMDYIEMSQASINLSSLFSNPRRVRAFACKWVHLHVMVMAELWVGLGQFALMLLAPPSAQNIFSCFPHPAYAKNVQPFQAPAPAICLAPPHSNLGHPFCSPGTVCILVMKCVKNTYQTELLSLNDFLLFLP